MSSSSLRCLVTAGPTREFIDPVRFISNPSSGKMGFALAQAALEHGWQVDLVSGPVALKAPEGVTLHKIVSGNEMYEKCRELFPSCDLFIMCAAVVDMRPKKIFDQKQKKDRIEWNVEFEPVIDILKTLSAKKTKQTVVGFAAETEQVRRHARRKLEEKRLDWIIANDVSGPDTAFESDSNRVEMYHNSGNSYKYGPDAKIEIARKIIERLSSAL